MRSFTKRRIYFLFLTSLFVCVNLWAYGGWKRLGPTGGTFSYFTFLDEKTVIAGNPLEAYVSKNNGKFWKKLSRGGTVRPTQKPGYVMLFDSNGDLYLSTDQGVRWEKKFEFAADGSFLLDITASRTAEEIYALVYSRSEVQFLVSADYGKTWARRSTLAEASYQYNEKILCMDDSIYTITGAKIFVSYNLGTTWKKLKTSGLPCCPILHSLDVFKNPRVLYITTRLGIFKSINDGSRWQKISKGSFLSLSVNEKNPAILYAVGLRSISSTTPGAIKSTNGGASWASLPLPKLGFTEISVHPADAETLFVAAKDYGILKSTNGGSAWVKVNNGINSVPLFELKFSEAGFFARSERTLFFSVDGTTWKDNKNLSFDEINLITANAHTLVAKVCCPDRMLISNDYASSWQVLHNGEPPGLSQVDSQKPKTVYMIFADNTGKKTEDGGITWKSISTRAIENPRLDFSTVLVTGNTPGSLWRATDNGRIYRSSNGGDSWKKTAAPGGKPIYEISVDPKNSNVIYVGAIVGTSSFTKRPALYRSSDGGSSWQLILDGAPSGLRINPNKTNEIIALNPRLLISTDYGKNWTDFGASSDAFETVYDVAFDRNDPRLMYFATSNGLFSKSR